MTSATAMWYPRVSHLRDVSTRAGVCRRPSRCGSSPSCSSISRTSVSNGVRAPAAGIGGRGSVWSSGKPCRLGGFILSGPPLGWAPGPGLSSAHVKLKVLAFLSTAGGSALSALWTFPSILASAFLVAWGAEAAQFLISQGLALAILAWLQTLPEFAVEAVIAWDAGREPERAHLAIANLTGAIRLLLGLGWPMIYFVFAVSV